MDWQSFTESHCQDTDCFLPIQHCDNSSYKVIKSYMYLAINWTTITSSLYTFTVCAVKHCQKHSGLSTKFAWVIQPFIHITIRNFFSNQITHLLSLHDFSSTLSHNHVKLNTNTLPRSTSTSASNIELAFSSAKVTLFESFSYIKTTWLHIKLPI